MMVHSHDHPRLLFWLLLVYPARRRNGIGLGFNEPQDHTDPDAAKRVGVFCFRR
jgi:hypothetical protein